MIMKNKEVVVMKEIQCIFCKIGNKEIQVDIIYEDEKICCNFW